MKTIAIAMALAVVASPALAKKAPHHKHAKHRHARVVVMDTQPLAGAPSAQAPGPMAGYDAYARMIAPYLSKELGANVVVENQPGAGGLTALNRIYSAPNDGLLLMIVNGTAAGLSQIVEEDAVHDIGKFITSGFRLCDLILMVREDQIQSTTVNIKCFT